MIIKPKVPKIPPGGFGKIFDKITKIGRYVWNVITGKDEIQDEISNRKGYNPEKNEANEIAELNKLLSEYRQNISNAGDEIEREMIVECSLQMDEIMSVFEEYNSSLKIARSDFIKRRFRNMSHDIKGTFSNYISKRISLDDMECVKALKLPSGELKSQRLQEIKQSVFIEAKDEILRKIKYTTEDFSDTIEDAFNEHLERSEQTISEKKDAFEFLSDNKEGNSKKAEEVILRADYIIALCSIANKIM